MSGIFGSELIGLTSLSLMKANTADLNRNIVFSFLFKLFIPTFMKAVENLYKHGSMPVSYSDLLILWTGLKQTLFINIGFGYLNRIFGKWNQIFVCINGLASDGLVSLFNGISTFCRSFNADAILLEEQ